MIIYATGFESGSFNREFDVAYRFMDIYITNSFKRSGNYALKTEKVPYNVAMYCEKIITKTTNLKHIYFVFYLYLTNLTANWDDYRRIFRITNISTNWSQVDLGFTNRNCNYLQATLNSNSLGISSVPIPQNQWVCIEGTVKVGVNGIFAIKQNGNIIINYTGNLSALPCIQKIGISANTNIDMYFDDIVIADTNGDYDNTWLGQGKSVLRLLPVRDSFQPNKNELEGKNPTNKFLNINKLGTALETNSNYLGVNGHFTTKTQLFKHQSLNRVTSKTLNTVIKAVIFNAGMKELYGKNLSFILNDLADTYFITIGKLGNEITRYYYVLPTNPFTNTRFELGEINKYEYGIKVTI
jgi:hypothetical protein